MAKKKTITLAKHLSKIQPKGGEARWGKLTEEERTELARNLANARWAKAKKQKPTSVSDDSK